MSLSQRLPGLPQPRMALIGRERELAAAHHILAQPETRLLTLTGVGGGGKTRLARQLLADLAPGFPGRCWLVELAPVVEPELIPVVVAEALGLHESSAVSSQAALVAALAPAPALLLLDNCEHLIEACAAFVDGLLDACPQVRVLATSREPLQIAGERQYRLPPLAVPALEAGERLEEIAAYPAVQLFVARAQAQEPAFELTAENAALVGRICARLDGIPLALELAAARVRVLGVGQLLARLDDSFRVLTGGSRVAPTRHQTLRGALAWSDALLTEPERAVFLRLAVFAGEFQLEAVEAVCADAPQHQILDAITGLVNKSLVVAESEARMAWYRLLEPVRQYAMERLAEQGALGAARARHAAYYLALGERATAGLRRLEQVAWLERLEREQGNLRVALEFARQQDDPALELSLAVAFALYWEMRGHLTEGLRWLRDALARGPEADHVPLRMRAYAAAGRLSYFLDHSLTSTYVEAEQFTRQSLHLAEQLGDEQAVATALCDLGMIHRLQRDLAGSVACLEGALVRFRAGGDVHGAAVALLNLGGVTYMQGDHERGTRQLQESLEQLDAIGDLRFAAAAQVLLAATAQDQREFDQAIQLLVEGLTTHDQLGDRWFVTFDLFALADVLLDAGQIGEGVRFMATAHALAEGLGSPVAGTAFAEAIKRVESLRGEEWFGAVWDAGYALDPRAVVPVARALLDGREPVDGPDPLTRRQREVARLIATGYTDRQIAEELFLSVHTVGVHVHNILQRLELRSRHQVAEWMTSRERRGAGAPDAADRDPS
ncbi:MAG TPA: LuxR C-terminal-related transcriptional regulator [Thermomicrobiales bacterium]|nr:LuxR C-terminal-related transcriptional regulator [Thermomicrobiales bacterium]